MTGADHLTRPGMANPNIAEWSKITHVGQAHWAGSGPEGRTCRECNFYKTAGHYANSGKHPRQLKDGRCDKYRQLMGCERGKRFTFRARACRFFDENPSPPPITAPRA